MSVLMLSVSGCRGVLGETLTPETIARFAGSYGTWLRERAGASGPNPKRRVTVVLGRDGRAGGEMVRAAAVAGLTGAGCDVLDIGVAMTPTVAVMTDRAVRDASASTSPEAVAGMVLTASHNPQEWNGLKCLLAEGGEFGSAACAPPANFANQIIDRFKGPGPACAAWNALGRVTLDEASAQVHVDRVMGALEDAGFAADAGAIGMGLNAAVDSVNASGVEGSRLMLEALGCEEILQLNNDESGLFPHPPEPTESNLRLPGGLCDAVREVQADVGFAQDPDADRLAIIDEQGRYVGEEYTLALGALALLEAEQKRGEKTQGQILVTNLSTSRMLEDVAARYGASVLRTPVGEANVVEIMKSRRSLAGGEGNGGVIWPRVAYVRDSLSAMAMILWLISPVGGGRGRKRSLSEIIASLPSYSIEKRKVDLKRREDALPAIDKIAKAYKSEAVDLQDGVRIDWKTGPWAAKAWLHVRASNTEPIMRLIAEAPTKTVADAILDQAARVIAS